MTGSVIIAAPLLIGAVVMAVRFVGCSFSPNESTANTPYSPVVLNTPNLVSFLAPERAVGHDDVDSKDGNNGEMRAR